MPDRKETNLPQFLKGIDGREKPEDGNGGSEVRTRWSWAAPSVWTDRMLAALETGVKGGRWYCLMDKVTKAENLMASFDKVRKRKGAAGVDRVSIAEFERSLPEHLGRIRQQLEDGLYFPQAVKRVYIDKAGGKEKRPLGIPTVRDRVVQRALCHVLEPIFENEFSEHSYGFRPGRSCKDALREVDRWLKSGYHWVLDADIKGYFDAISHDRLMELVGEKVSDRSVMGLVEKYLQQDILEGMKCWQPATGTPQGAVLSPLLANIYLNPLDHLMSERNFKMIRYADDFVIMCHSEAQANVALKVIRNWAESAALTLHPEKTRIVDATQRGGFEFLGYRFERGMRFPRAKSMKSLRAKICAKTKRCNGHSMETIIEQINPILRGWFNYYKHSFHNVMGRVDGYVRMRLRSILRKRRKCKGRGRGSDHQRWPNAYFAKLGLYSLKAARGSLCQSAQQ